MNMPEPGSWHNGAPKKEIEPGTFHNEEHLDIIDVKMPNLVQEVKVETYEGADFLKKLLLFKEQFNPKLDVIYYPCSNSDITPTKAFPESRIIYVDLEDSVIETLKKNGQEAHEVSALEFNPVSVDVLIMLNPQIKPDIPASFVASGGYVLVNNYHNTANLMQQLDSFNVVGVINTYEGEESLDTVSLEDYFKEVESDEEFQGVQNGFNEISFENARKIVKIYNGKDKDILSEYKKIINDELEKEIKEWKELKLTDPEMAEYEGNPENKDVLLVRRGGEDIVLTREIPKKKGSAGSLCIFQKK